MLIAYLTALLIILADQALKCWVQTSFQLHQSKPGIEGIFQWFYLHNDGAGWGLLGGKRTILILVSLFMVAYFIYLIRRNRHLPGQITWIYGLLLGGAIGNLIDRVRLGYVVDMIQVTFIDFPVFNLADASLSIGLVLLLISLWLSPYKEELL